MSSDVRTLANQALQSERGLAIRVKNHAAAVRLRFGFYSMRKADRQANRKTMGEFVSIYDSLQVIFEEPGDGGWIVKLIPNTVMLSDIEAVDIATGSRVDLVHDRPAEQPKRTEPEGPVFDPADDLLADDPEEDEWEDLEEENEDADNNS